MNEVWNLDPIYKGFDDPAFEADMAALKDAVAAIAAFAEKLPELPALEGLTQGITLEENFSELVSKLAGYASLRQAANTRDSEAGSRMGQIMALYSGVAAPFAAFKDWATKQPDLMEVVTKDENMFGYVPNLPKNIFFIPADVFLFLIGQAKSENLSFLDGI